jgi:hypothetical protein
MLPPALSPLAAWPQFIAWRIESRATPNGDVPTKVPYSPIHGGKASTTNPADWGSYEQAAAMPGMAGVGFVFTERDPFWFLDIDGALQPGPPAAWSTLAQELCARLPGAAVEVSQSGNGLHIIGSTSVPLPPAHSNKNTALKLEFYSRWRFVALTGAQCSGSVSTVLDAPVQAVLQQYFPIKADTTSTEWTTEPDAAWSGPEDDNEIIALITASDARKAGAVFSGANDKPDFAALFTADRDRLARAWPSNASSGLGFDASSADQSLANVLAFWTGRHCERIERIMRLSALARDKWDSHSSYIETTVLKARALVTDVYRAGGKPSPTSPGGAAVPPPPPPEEILAAGFEPRGDGGLMLAQEQMRHFAGCIYITALNKVLTSEGQRLDQARFDVKYGGHSFVIDTRGEAKPTTSAWLAFTENQNFAPPTADRLCFRPEIGSCGIVDTGSMKLANSYVRIHTPRTDGDPAPYLDLLRRQLPDERDRAILLHYMASVVQNPGLKAQWWPVLQSMEGTAKTAHIEAMVHAVGEQYIHLPNTAKMIRNGMNFNGWIDGKLFVGLEEVYAAERRSFFEEFKATVTNRRLPIEGKGIEEATYDNRANGMLCTNHKEGVPIERRNRRYSVFFMAQQNDGDLERDGMTSVYFSDFYDWFYGRGEYASRGGNYGLMVINTFLHTFPLTIAEFDPARLATRAPATSSMEEALGAGRGRAEQEIIEAIEEEQPGFAGGWVSSVMLDKLLDRHRLSQAIPRNKRREMLEGMGYICHPALGPGGRTNNAVALDGSKPRLFVKRDSIQALNLHDNAAVARAYSEAQLKASGERSAAGQTFGGGK